MMLVMVGVRSFTYSICCTYMMKGAFYQVNRDTAVEFIAWLCNNNAACEVLHFSVAAVYSCFEICESIWWFSRFSIHCNVSNSHQALTEVS